MIFSPIVKTEENHEINGFAVLFKPSLKSKRLILKYINGFVLSVPKGCSGKKAIKFVESCEKWMNNIHLKSQIRQKIHDAPKIANGEMIEILGIKYEIIHQEGRGISQLNGQKIIICGKAEHFKRRFAKFITDWAREIFQENLIYYCQLIKFPVPKLVIRDTKSRWGSCNHDGSVISLSPRLMFAPNEVMKYVVAHEVSHCIHHNHSDKFWQLVAKLDENFQENRLWLKKHGANIMNYTMIPH